MVSFGQEGFDATAPENQRTNSVVPAGEYTMILNESERKDTSKGDGAYLNCKFQIVSGEFQNRIVFKKFNLWVASEQARKIAKGEFSEFCRSVGVLNPKDSAELNDKPFVGKVKVKSDDTYGDQNEVVRFKPTGNASAAPIAKRPATASTSDGNPWG